MARQRGDNVRLRKRFRLVALIFACGCAAIYQSTVHLASLFARWGWSFVVVLLAYAASLIAVWVVEYSVSRKGVAERFRV